MSSLLVPVDESNAVTLHTWTGNYWSDIWHFPERYQLWYLQAGKGTLTFANRMIQLQTGDVYFVCPGQFNKGKPAPGHHWSVVHLTIDVAYLHAVLTRLNRSPDLLPTVADQLIQNRALNQYLAEHLSLLSRQLHPSRPTAERAGQTEQFLRRFLLALDDRPVSQSVIGQQAVARSIYFLQQHYQRRIRLSELAHQACLSKFRLVRAFTAHTGLSPHQFQLQLRLNEARRMLHQQRPLADIAFELGFTDLSHFINVFKRYTQLSPKQYQQQLGGLVVP